MVAGLEGPAPKVGVRHQKEGRKAHPANLRGHPLGDLDASTVGAWKAADRGGLAPRTVNTYLSLLGTILNAAVDDDHLARSPLLRKGGAGRAAATRTSTGPTPHRQRRLRAYSRPISASPRQFDFPRAPIFNAPAKLFGLVGRVSRELRLTIRAANGFLDLSMRGRTAHDECARRLPGG